MQIPPLRKREGDVGLLVDSLWRKLNVVDADELSIEPKTLSSAARNLLLNRHWSGKVRELQNTLTRILVCCDDDVVSGENVKGAFFQVSETLSDVLNRELDDDLSLERLPAEVSSHCIERAKKQSATKKGAAKLLGFPIIKHLIIRSKSAVLSK